MTRHCCSNHRFPLNSRVRDSSRTPAVLGVPDQPRELCKRLDAAVLTTVFPSTPESVTQVRSLP
ncbi:hypothetical protein Taro_054588 [Colocasia esculenta]|uniref:Uncharacterized protein n=1 Tax=Colocasia esculenta TaxID=4460 RepID=A0A843XRM8_COLES|nr:hypothetical protein [Colocasia esculenta]